MLIKQQTNGNLKQKKNVQHFPCVEKFGIVFGFAPAMLSVPYDKPVDCMIALDMIDT